ncbi:ABC transporter permease subunit [Pseudonocardia sp. GCM10023141]|uniref:ABC transporter permease subunit n=1 Tax=Pseudonocardia sp. GCM10023141 TaxID=3252653 RepID=UPI003622A438
MKKRAKVVAPLAVLVPIVVVGLVMRPQDLDQLTLWAIEGILALSLVLLWGHGGIFSLGQTALYGLGGYAFGIVAINLGRGAANSMLLGGLAALVVAALVSLVIGYLMFYGRVSEVNVGIITLALTLVLFVLINSTADPAYRIGDAPIGGFNGLVGIPAPMLFGQRITGQSLFFVVCGAAVVALTLVWWCLDLPFGRIAAAVRSNELRAELLGYDVRARRTMLFVVCGCLAGGAGALFAAWGQFASPTIFGLKSAIIIVIWVLVGSRTSPVGAFVGVFAVEALTSWLGGEDARYALIYLGAILIAAVILLPNGLVTTARRLTRRFAPARKKPIPVDGSLAQASSSHDLSHVLGARPPSDTQASLVVSGLTKRYGAVTVVDAIDLDLPATGLQVVIGPNGAGKSTFFGLVNGTVKIDTGTVRLGETDVSRMLPHRRARAGIGTKRQVVSVFADLTVRENLWVAAYAPRARRSVKEATAAADDLVSWLGLAGATVAGTLSHGDQQRLEIVMVMASGASLILLDEPTAGMTVNETAGMAALIHTLSEHCSVVVIDHDMGFVRELGAPITVMHLGQVLMRGELDALEADERLLDIYLGRHNARA